MISSMTIFHFNEPDIMRIYLDVETLPSQAAGARELAAQGVKPPATHKKPETIRKWWEEEGERAIEEAYRKQALDAASGELCAIGFCNDDSEPTSIVRMQHETERDFIQRVFDGIQELLDTAATVAPDGHHFPDDVFFICHNAPFDLGFIWRRCIVHGIRPPFPIPRPAARDGKDFGDTMTLWAGYRNTISLDRLCRALGVKSPKADGMDGSQVFDKWLAFEYDLVGDYNAEDVRATRECWWKMNFMGVAA